MTRRNESGMRWKWKRRVLGKVAQKVCGVCLHQPPPKKPHLPLSSDTGSHGSPPRPAERTCSRAHAENETTNALRRSLLPIFDLRRISMSKSVRENLQRGGGARSRVRFTTHATSTKVAGVQGQERWLLRDLPLDEEPHMSLRNSHNIVIPDMIKLLPNGQRGICCPSRMRLAMKVDKAAYRQGSNIA